MKKLFFTMFVCTMLIPFAHAQSPRFGFTVGGTLASYRTNVDDMSATSSSTLGFSVGAIADIPVGETFTFQPSLQFLQKGGEESHDIGGTTYKSTLHINYLELPLNFLYKTPGKEGNFVFGLGPCLAYGLGGTEKASGGGMDESTSIKFGTNEAFQNAFEFSGNIVAGYHWASGFLLQANYNIGFTNLWSSDNGSYKNNYFGLRVGYLFGGK